MKKLCSCEFNIDTACMELRFADGTMIAIACTAVENEVEVPNEILFFCGKEFSPCRFSAFYKQPEMPNRYEFLVAVKSVIEKALTALRFNKTETFHEHFANNRPLEYAHIDAGCGLHPS